MGQPSFYAGYWSDANHAIPTAGPLHGQRERHIRGLLARYPKGRVVDGGCGSGGLTSRWAGAAGEVLALDLSENAIAAAPALGDRVRFVAADLEARWPVDDGWADLVVSSEVIEHVFDFPSYLAEAHRVLRPGGTLYLTTPYHGPLKNLVLAVWGFDKHYCSYESGHIRFFSNAHLERLAKAAGFRAVRFGSLGRIPPLAASTVLYATR